MGPWVLINARWYYTLGEDTRGNSSIDINDGKFPCSWLPCTYARDGDADKDRAGFISVEKESKDFSNVPSWSRQPGGIAPGDVNQHHVSALSQHMEFDFLRDGALTTQH